MAEEALNEINSLLQRMLERAIENHSDLNRSEDRAEFQQKVDKLAAALTWIVNETDISLNFAATFHTGVHEKRIDGSSGNRSCFKRYTHKQTLFYKESYNFYV